MLQELSPLKVRLFVPAEVAIVVPTFNERDNVRDIASRIASVLDGRLPWEIVFVDDDSCDGTTDLIHQLCREDPRIRLIRRLGRRGLSSAVVEGILSTSAPYIAVMDADLQHDERLLEDMLDQLRDAPWDLVVGSRYVKYGSVGEWENSRVKISWIATRLAQLALRAPLSDPMSGFFMLRRETFEHSVRNLSVQGYKILLDIVASAPRALQIKELPYTFRPRVHGESKLDALVALEFFQLLLDKTIGRWVPVRFVMFGAVGCLGVLLHMAALAAVLKGAGLNFVQAQTIATAVAMTGNFFLNNVLTHRDKRLKGVGPVLLGLMSFCAVCGIGGVANVGIANVLFASDYTWWLSALAGILVGAVWNYAVSSVVTWRKQ